MLVVFLGEGGRQNRSSAELVMEETRIRRSQYLQVTDVRKWTDVWSPDVRSGQKSANFWWIKSMGPVGEMLDPLETKQIHGSNPTKFYHTNKSQKNWGYFWWGFSD